MIDDCFDSTHEGHAYTFHLPSVSSQHSSNAATYNTTIIAAATTTSTAAYAATATATILTPDKGTH